MASVFSRYVCATSDKLSSVNTKQAAPVQFPQLQTNRPCQRNLGKLQWHLTAALVSSLVGSLVDLVDSLVGLVGSGGLPRKRELQRGDQVGSPSDKHAADALVAPLLEPLASLFLDSIFLLLSKFPHLSLFLLFSLFYSHLLQGSSCRLHYNNNLSRRPG